MYINSSTVSRSLPARRRVRQPRLYPGRPFPRAISARAARAALDEGRAHGHVAVHDVLVAEGLAVVAGPAEALQVVALVAPMAEAQVVRPDLKEARN